MPKLTVKRAGRNGLLALIVVLSMLSGSTPDLTGQRIEQLAGPYAWSAVAWEGRHLGDGIGDVVDQALHPIPPARLAEEVRAYLAGQRSDAPLSSTRALLAGAVAAQLREDGAPVVGPLVAPPVTLALTPPLRLLVVSPRDEIREAYWVLLDDSVSLPEAVELEREVEALGVSALAVEGIALSTYPTLIPTNTPPAYALETVAHEWTHTALFFTPLGRAYGGSPEARAINETTADVVGKEVADELMAKAGIDPRPARAVESASVLTEQLRAIRQQVDALLAAHDVDGAEQYMEIQREALEAQGYRIRRLNQAYFAFHGNYAEGPSASTEVPDTIRAIRAQSASIADFLGRVGSVTSVAGLRRAAGSAQP